MFVMKRPIQHKKFKKFSIKSQVTVACPKCKKHHKIGLRALEVNLEPKIHQIVHGEVYLISFEPKNITNIVWILLLVYSVVFYC